MTNFSLPKDNNSTAVQAVRPDTNSTQTVSNAGAILFSLATGTSLVRIASTVNCFFKFGDSGVVATSTDVLFPTGAEIFSVNGAGYTHVSILGAEASPGSASATKMV